MIKRKRAIVGLALGLAGLLTGALAFAESKDNNYSRVSEGESARTVDLARARHRLEAAKTELFEARKHLAQLMEERGPDASQKGLLGFVMMPAPSRGVRIAKVLSESPADRAGLGAGDLITAINGAELPDYMDRDAVLDAAYNNLGEVKSGMEVQLTMLRGDRRFNATLVAESRPGAMYCYDKDGCRPFRHEPVVPLTGSPETMAGPEASWNMVLPEISANLDEATAVLPFMEHYGHLANGLTRQMLQGLELAELNSALGQYFGAEQGVLVVRAPVGVPGLHSGDVIVACGDIPVTTPRQFMHMLMSYQQGDEVLFKLVRNRRQQVLNVHLPENLAGN